MVMAFTMFVNEGDKITVGQPLIKFSKDKIIKAGHKATTMLIITENANKNFEFNYEKNASAGKTTVAVWKEA